MNSEEALAIVEKTLVEEPLSKLQASVFRYAWEEQPYQEIAKELGYEVGYLKQTGSQLWQVLSRAFGEKVSKSNVQLVLKRKANEFTNIRVATASSLQLSQNQRCDWGNAPDVSVFYGRHDELAILEQWIVGDRCRWVGLFGMGGIGKTCLAVKLAQEIQSDFDYIIWRSLRNAPPIVDLLTDLIQFLSQQTAVVPNTLDGCILRLLHYLRAHRCLLILDNSETITNNAQTEFEGYEQLFKCLGITYHQSTLLVTGREKPSALVAEEGATLPMRSLRVSGLSESAIQKIFDTKGNFAASAQDWQALVRHYAGNPLALKIVGAGIKDFFDGNINNFLTFLSQESGVFGDIRDLLKCQTDCLTLLEQQVMYWLAINREPISLCQLRADFVGRSLSNLLEAVKSLERKCLIDIAPAIAEKPGSYFTLQPVVMEYTIDKFIEQIVDEIQQQNLYFFKSHAIIKATAKDYIREIQVRLILQPILTKLININNHTTIETKFQQILDDLRASPPAVDYTGGNLLNLLCHFQTNLSGWDFSQISILQAYLCRANLHGVNFQSTQFSHSIFTDTFSQVLAVAFSPDGKLLATGDVNHEIHIWQVVDGKQILTCKIDAGWVWSVAFSPNGRLLASSANRTVNLWDVQTGQCIKTFHGYTDRVFSLSFSPDGCLLASGSEDHFVRVWHLKTGELQTLVGHSDEVRSVAFAPQHDVHSRQGRLLASGSFDGTVRVWNVDTGACLKCVEHRQQVWCVAFSPDGRIIASGSSDRTIKLWDVSTGINIQTLIGHAQQIRTVAFSNNGQTLFSGSDDQSIRLWNYHTGEVLRVLKGHTSWISAVAFNSQAGILASSSEDQSVRLWDSHTNFCVKTLQGHSNGVWCVAFSPDGTQLASGSQDRLIRFWDLTGKQLGSLQGHTSWIWSVAFHPEGNLLASGSEDCTIRLWNVRNGESRKIQGHADAVFAVVFSPDGDTLISGSLDGTIKLWNIPQGTCQQTLRGHSGGIWSIALSVDGTILASGSQDQTIKIWDVRSRRCLQTLSGHSSWIRACAISPDQQYLVSGSADGTIKIWRIDTGRCIDTIPAHTGPVLSIIFDVRGNFISSGTDAVIKRWRFMPPDASATLCCNLLGHEKWVRFLAYSSCGMLASCSQDETIKLWKIHNNLPECTKTLQIPRPYEGMNITDVKGLTGATINTLKMLGAVDHAAKQ